MVRNENQCKKWCFYNIFNTTKSFPFLQTSIQHLKRLKTSQIRTLPPKHLEFRSHHLPPRVTPPKRPALLTVLRQRGRTWESVLGLKREEPGFESEVNQVACAATLRKAAATRGKVGAGGKPLFVLILTPEIQAPRLPLSTPNLTGWQVARPVSPPILPPTPHSRSVLRF